MAKASDYFGKGSFGSGYLSTPHMGYKSGKYYLVNTLTSASTTTSQTLVTGGVTYIPFYVHSDVNVSAVCFENADTSANTVEVRIGIYNNSGGVPSQLKIAAPKITLTSTASMREISTSFSLEKGWYWAAFSSSADVVVRAASPQSLGNGWSLNAFSTPVINDLAGVFRNFANFSYAALPDPAVEPTANSLYPMFWLKVA